MTAVAFRGPGLHPLHAVLLAAAFPLFLGALIADWAYSSTYQVQWTNFSSWLIAGALVFTGFALLWAVIDLLRADRRGQRPWLYVLLLLATFVFGFVSALVHAKDAFAAMPGGLILSIVTLLLIAAAVWVGFFRMSTGGRA